MNQYPNGPQQPNQYPSNPGYPPQGQPGYTQYPPQGQPGYPSPGQYTPPPPGYQQPPMPQQPQQTPKKKKNKLAIGCGSVVALAVLIAIISAVSSGGKGNTGTTVSTTSNSSTSNNTNAAPPAQQHFKVGDTVKVGTDWQAVVNSVKTDSGGDFSTLKPGDTYLVVDTSVTNLTNTEQTVSSELNFTLQDTTGLKYTEGIDTNAGASLDGKVEAGQPLRGTIAYEVPASIHNFTFNFSPDITGTGQTTWDLSV